MFFLLLFCITSLWLVNTALYVTSINPIIAPVNTPGNATVKGENLENIIVEFTTITGTSQTKIASVIDDKHLPLNSEVKIQIPVYTSATFAIIRSKSSQGSWSKHPILFQYYEQPSFSCCIPSQVIFTGSDLIMIRGKNFFYSQSITVKLSASWFTYNNKVVKVNFINSTALEFNAPVSSYSTNYRSTDYSVHVSLAMDGINYVPMSDISFKSSFSYKFQDLYKFGFLFIGPVDDGGWSFAQNGGRRELEGAYPGRVETRYYTTVGYDDIEVLGKQLCEEGYDFIMTGSDFYVEPSMELAKADVCKNSHILSTANLEWIPGRLSGIFAKVFQAKYLAGMTAGYTMLKDRNDPDATPRGSQCVGYIGGVNIPEVYRGFNAFAMGCRRANPNCTVKALFLMDWFHPEKERHAAEFLWHSEKCDIIAQETDTSEPAEVFNELGGYIIGYNSDMSERYGRSVLTSAYFAWGGIYSYFLDKLIKNQLTGEKYFPGMVDGAAALYPFSNIVDRSARARILEASDQIRNGEFDVFCGPIEGDDGLSFPEENYEDRNTSKCFTDDALEKMKMPVVGVEFISAKITEWGRIDLIDGEPIFSIVKPPEYEYEQPLFWRVLFILLSCVGIIIVLFTAVFMYRYRNNKWFKAHSVKLMFFILLSCFLQLMIPIILARTPTQESCIIVRFLAHLAFIVCAPPICLKTYRLHKFFAAARHLRTARCTDKQLITWIIAFLIIFVIYSCFWFVYIPPNAKREYVAKLDKYSTSCSQPSTMDTILYVPEVMILLYAVQLVAMIRSIPKQFNESKYIGFTLYTVFVLTIILGTFFFATGNQEPFMTYFLENFGILVIAGVTFISLFGVKIKKILKNEQYSVRKNLTMHSSGIRLKPTGTSSTLKVNSDVSTSNASSATMAKR